MENKELKKIEADIGALQCKLDLFRTAKTGSDIAEVEKGIDELQKRYARKKAVLWS